MTHSSSPDERFVARFLTEHPEGGVAELNAWATGQPELAADPGMLQRGREVLEHLLEVRELLPCWIRIAARALGSVRPPHMEL